VPHVGETKTLSRLSFDSNQFLTALEDLSVSGLMESLSRGFTSMFMHANAAHIFGNMLMLALFAPWVQSALGGRRTMVIYLAGGLGAVAAHAFSAPEGLLLGASAAISALLGAALTIWSKPKDEDAFNWRVVFQAFAIILLFDQVKNLVVQGPTTPEHVATLAHVVGAGVGLSLGGWYALRRALRKKRAA